MDLVLIVYCIILLFMPFPHNIGNNCSNNLGHNDKTNHIVVKLMNS